MEGMPLGDALQLRALPRSVYYLSRLLPSIRARRITATTLAGFIKAAHPWKPAPLLPEMRVGVEALRHQGWAALPATLSKSQISDIYAFLQDKPLVDKDGRRFTADAAPSDTGLASYPLETVLQCPHIIELMNRPSVLQAASAYLGCAPTITGLRIDWSAPSSVGAGHVQCFHRDYDDWRFMKLFVYLTDVDDDSGPHEYVATSHLKSGRFRARHYDEEALDLEYGREQRIRVTGPAGTSFFVDTWGIHRGNVPQTRQRLMLQIQYAMLPVLKFDYRPVKLALAPQYDRYVNRLMISPLEVVPGVGHDDHTPAFKTN